MNTALGFSPSVTSTISNNLPSSPQLGWRLALYLCYTKNEVTNSDKPSSLVHDDKKFYWTDPGTIVIKLFMAVIYECS